MFADVCDQEHAGAPSATAEVDFSYEEAFSRNIGLFTAEEQQRLRRSHVAIAGMGGVGGVHLIALARTGIGKFTIADPDRFELANMNRQYGARVDTLGRSKVEVMAEAVRQINPQALVRTFDKPIGTDNIANFLESADVVIDGLDFYAMQARRLLFRAAYERGIWGITCGPHAFSAAHLVFSPYGMTFDAYFDLSDGMSEIDQSIAFGVGGTPRAIHLPYLDDLKKYFIPGERRGASAGLTCQLASGIVAADVIKLLLGRGTVRPVPAYLQFDAYRQKLVRGTLWFGNRHPLQRIKIWWLTRKLVPAATAVRRSTTPSTRTS
ncbi:MAG TPA: ThiF family adenylyltransferase [Pirellulales bacterium]|nr:ThiF family adenylyltransferase [Pirellulales bacterium]